MVVLVCAQVRFMGLAFGGKELVFEEDPNLNLRKVHYNLIKDKGLTLVSNGRGAAGNMAKREQNRTSTPVVHAAVEIACGWLLHVWCCCHCACASVCWSM